MLIRRALETVIHTCNTKPRISHYIHLACQYSIVRNEYLTFMAIFKAMGGKINKTSSSPTCEMGYGFISRCSFLPRRRYLHRRGVRSPTCQYETSSEVMWVITAI